MLYVRVFSEEKNARCSEDAYGDIDNENGDVAQRTASRSQVGERLVTGRIDDEETRNLELEGIVLRRDVSLST